MILVISTRPSVLPESRRWKWPRKLSAACSPQQRDARVRPSSSHWLGTMKLPLVGDAPIGWGAHRGAIGVFGIGRLSCKGGGPFDPVIRWRQAYCRALDSCHCSGPIFPDRAVVSDTLNIPQHDVGDRA